MRQVFFRSAFLAAVIAAGTFASSGQTAAPSMMSGRMLAGETLKYDGKINKILRGISVAELEFTTRQGITADELIIESSAVSKGTLLKLFRFSFAQEFESTIDLARFRILKTSKHDVQKQRVRDSEAIFNYVDKRVRYVETDPKDPTRPPRRIASEIGDEMHDMISAIYAMRILPLTVGKRIEFQVSDSGLVYKIPFTVTAREQQKTVLGKVWCYRVEPEIFGKDRLIEQKGSMVIWVTEDARHTPVRARVSTGYGKIDIKLASVSVAGV
jgi:hypothetical protein